MIFGIGTDICDIRRMEATLHRQGERFVRKVLSEGEFAVWQRRTARWPQRGLRFLATRFSAKEAFSKAIGLGMRMPMTWRTCEIANLASGQPVMNLSTGQTSAITETSADERPSFAPNSKLIVYATVLQGREALMTTTLDGKIKAKLSGQSGDIREPAWGPYR